MDSEIWCVCMYAMKYYSTSRMKKIRGYCTAWMNLENTLPSEVSQPQKYK